MASTPVFTDTPNIQAVSIATANTNLDGTGTIGTVFTAGSGGSRIHRIKIKAIVTTTAGMIRLFLYDGSTYYLYSEIAVPAITKSASVAAFEATLQLWGEGAIVLPNGWSLRAATEKAETFKIIAEGADF